MVCAAGVSTRIRQSDRQSDEIELGVYTVRSSDRPVGPTGLSDWSVRRSYRVNASCDRSDRRSEESNMFDFVRLPIRLSKRVDTTFDWSVRPRLRSTAYVAAFCVIINENYSPVFLMLFSSQLFLNLMMMTLTSLMKMNCPVCFHC